MSTTTTIRDCDGSCGGHQEDLGTGCLAHLDDNAPEATLANASFFARPTHVMHTNIDTLCEAMRRAGRAELVHYAGASWRDDVAWHVCVAWMSSPVAPERVLLDRAYKATGWN